MININLGPGMIHLGYTRSFEYACLVSVCVLTVIDDCTMKWETFDRSSFSCLKDVGPQGAIHIVNHNILPLISRQGDEYIRKRMP